MPTPTHRARVDASGAQASTKPHSKLFIASITADVHRIFERLSDSRLPTTAGSTASGRVFMSTAMPSHDTPPVSTAMARTAAFTMKPSTRQPNSPTAEPSETKTSTVRCGCPCTKANHSVDSAATPTAAMQSSASAACAGSAGTHRATVNATTPSAATPASTRHFPFAKACAPR